MSDHHPPADGRTTCSLTFLDPATRFLLFTGKGGVGKTALACATALRLAEGGWRVLLVSTDPASNLGEMLGVALTTRATPIPGADRLWALDLDPARAAADYRERVIAPYRAIWSADQVDALTEQLAGACTVEMAAFDTFAELLAGDTPFDHVVFDTAPSGHTLRLLGLPRAWTAFLASTTEGASCLGPHAGLRTQQHSCITLAGLRTPRAPPWDSTTIGIGPAAAFGTLTMTWAGRFGCASASGSTSGMDPVAG